MTKKELLKTFLMHNAQRNIVYTVYGQSKKLPDEYQEVEYLESTGTQWIDTGYIPNQSTKFSIKNAILFDSTSSKLAGHGLGSGYGNNRCVIGTSGQGSNIVYYGIYSGNYEGLNTTFQYEKDVPFIATIDLSKPSYSFNGIEKTVTATPSTTTGAIYLFVRNQTPYLRDMVNPQRLYWAKMEENNTLVRNFIPCYRKADNVAGMYDLVNGQFYTNQGTGSFIVGNDVPSTIVSIKPPISFDEKKLGKNLFIIEPQSVSSTTYVNICPNIQVKARYGASNVNIAKSGNIYNFTRTSSASLLLDGKLINCKPNTKYTMSFTCISNSGGTVHFSGVYNLQNAINQPKTITFTTNSSGEYEFTYFLFLTNVNQECQIKDIQLEEGSTATAYEPYIGDLRGTGEVKDILETSGTLTRKFAEVNLGSLEWRWNGNNDFYSTTINTIIKPAGKVLCAKYQSVMGWGTDKAIFVGTSGAIGITDSSYTDDSTFKTAMQGVKLIYELATPTETTFTPLELTSGLTVVDSNGTTPEYTEN